MRLGLLFPTAIILRRLTVVRKTQEKAPDYGTLSDFVTDF